jgi:hypothetical protein
MQLTYRGQSYKFFTVSVDLDNSQATGKYHGFDLPKLPNDIKPF